MIVGKIHAILVFLSLNEEAGYKREGNWPNFNFSYLLALGNGLNFKIFISPRMTCTFLYHITVLKI